MAHGGTKNYKIDTLLSWLDAADQTNKEDKLTSVTLFSDGSGRILLEGEEVDDFFTVEEANVPYNGGGSGNFELVFETKQHEKAANGLKDLHNAFIQSKRDLTALRCDIENTLYALKTLKAISEHFPEALPYLPKTPNTSLIIDTTALRERLK